MNPTAQKRNPTARDGGLRSWVATASALRSIRQFLRLAWQTHPGYAAATTLLCILRAAVPLAALWVAKLIIDTVIAARSGHASYSRLWTLLAIEIAIAVLGEAMSKASTVIEALFGDLCSNEMSERLIRHAATLDLSHFEDAAFYDQLERAQRQTTGRIGLLGQILSLAQDAVTFVSSPATVRIPAQKSRRYVCVERPVSTFPIGLECTSAQDRRSARHSLSFAATSRSAPNGTATSAAATVQSALKARSEPKRVVAA